MKALRFAGGLILAVVLALGLAVGGEAPARAAATFPALSGRVVDQAHVLSPEVQAQLTQSLAALEAKTSRQLIVVTLPSLQGYDIADYGYQLGRTWGVGQKGLNNGVLLIVAPTEHKVRVEVGYGLEPIVTDAVSNLILQQKVLPRFRVGDVQGGVVDGTQALIDQMSLDPSTAEAKAAAASQAQVAPGRSGGGGLPIGALILVFVLFWVIRSIMGGRGGGGLGWFLSGMLLGGGIGGGRGSRDDDFGGGGGGGFSGGGGGSFGGGGSSGSW